MKYKKIYKFLNSCNLDFIATRKRYLTYNIYNWWMFIIYQMLCFDLHFVIFLCMIVVWLYLRHAIEIACQESYTNNSRWALIIERKYGHYLVKHFAVLYFYFWLECEQENWNHLRTKEAVRTLGSHQVISDWNIL